MAMTPDERRELIEAVTGAMSASVGPTGDLHRAVMSAKVDGLIDARQRFINAGWPDWMVYAAVMALITGASAPYPVQVGIQSDDG